MEFVSSNVIVKKAMEAQIAKTEEASNIQSYLDVYDMALDGRLDHGFFSMQIQSDMYITVDHPLSADGNMVRRINSLISRFFPSDKPQAVAVKPEDVAANDTLDSPLAIAAAALVSPFLLIFGSISGCGPYLYRGKYPYAGERIEVFVDDERWTGKCRNGETEVIYGFSNNNIVGTYCMGDEPHFPNNHYPFQREVEKTDDYWSGKCDDEDVEVQYGYTDVNITGSFCMNDRPHHPDGYYPFHEEIRKQKPNSLWSGRCTAGQFEIPLGYDKNNTPDFKCEDPQPDRNETNEFRGSEYRYYYSR